MVNFFLKNLSVAVSTGIFDPKIQAVACDKHKVIINYPTVLQENSFSKLKLLFAIFLGAQLLLMWFITAFHHVVHIAGDYSIEIFVFPQELHWLM